VQSLTSDSRSTVVDAPPAAVWSVVTDPPRHADLSPEVSAASWLDGATGPRVGARFVATNTVNGKSWKNRPVVTEVVPERVFAFARTEPFAGTVAWRWELAQVGTGTQVTLSYEVTRRITRVGWFVIERVFGCGQRQVELGEGMEQTLHRLSELVAASEGDPVSRSAAPRRS
jgi:uncharacterized protein YndB with AHSA1/START domain